MNKRDWYTSDKLPSEISDTYGNSSFTLNNPTNPPQVLVLNYGGIDTQHTILSDKTWRGSMKRGYCSRFHDIKTCHKKSRFYCYMCSINKRIYYYNGNVRMISQLITWFIEHHHCTSIDQVYWCVFLPYIHYLICQNVFVLVLLLISWSYSVPIIISALHENFTLQYCYCIFEWMQWHPFQTHLI